MDKRRFTRFLPLAAISAVFTTVAFAYSQGEHSGDLSFASLGDLFGAGTPPSSPEAVILHIDSDTPDPRIIAFDHDYGADQGLINQKQDEIWDTGLKRYGVDRVLLDSVLDRVDSLQEELDKKYLEYIALTNAQGGFVTPEQDEAFRNDCILIESRINSELIKADKIAHGSKVLTAA